MKKNKYISYVYAGLFLLIISIILVENSYLLINQTSSNITETSWLEAEKLVQSIVASAKHSIESVQLTNQQVSRYVRKTALLIDQLDFKLQSRAEEDIKDIIRNYKLQKVSIIDSSKKVISSYSLTESFGADFQSDIDSPSEKSTNNLLQTFPLLSSNREIDIKRVTKDGFVRISISNEFLQEIKSRIGLQLLLTSLENQNVVQYASFLNDQLMVLADYEPSRVGTIEEKLEYLDSLNTGVSYFLRKDNIMEIIHPLILTQNTRGVFKIGFALAGLDKIYSRTSQITLINSLVILILAIIAVIITITFHNRNMNKMATMQNTIRENEKLVSLGNLTSGVAHEVRNPLNSISITIQRLQYEFSPEKAEDQAEYIALTTTMKKEVDRINMIITDLLDFSKPFKPKKSIFKLDDFLESNIALFKGEADKKNVSLIKQIYNKEEQIFADQQKLTQVLINLLHNALDATPPKGSITIYSNITKDNHWELKIQDNGRGISKNHLSQIFDIYFTTKGTGSGLGLYISRKIIQAHKGTIELVPNSGSGITAIITLPNLMSAAQT